MKGRKFLKGLLFVPLIIGLIALVGFVIMSLWNWLMPDIFGLGEMTFWQAIGLGLLARILFGRAPGRKGGGSWSDKKNWKNRMKAKWANMSPEQRTEMKERFGSKWDCYGAAIHKKATETDGGQMPEQPEKS